MRNVGETLMIFGHRGRRDAARSSRPPAASRPQRPLFQKLVGGALIICALAVCTACSTGSDSTSGGLTVTREDGSTVEFEGSVRAWCGPPRDGGGTALQLGSGVPVSQSRPSGTRETERSRTSWLLFSLVERLERAPVLSLRERPIDSTTWTFFVNDLETGNEAAAKNEEARARSLSAAGAAIRATQSRSRLRRLSGASSATAKSFALQASWRPNGDPPE